MPKVLTEDYQAPKKEADTLTIPGEPVAAPTVPEPAAAPPTAPPVAATQPEPAPDSFTPMPAPVNAEQVTSHGASGSWEDKKDSFVPVDSIEQKPQMENAFLPDKNIVVAFPKGREIDQINQDIQTQFYHVPKDDYFMGVDLGRTARNLAKGFAGNIGNIGMAGAGELAKAADQMEGGTESFDSLWSALNPDTTGEFLNHQLNPIQKISDLSRVADFGYGHLMEITNSVANYFGKHPAPELRDASTRLQNATQDFLVKHGIEGPERKDTTFTAEQTGGQRFLTEELPFAIGQGLGSIGTSMAITYVTKKPWAAAALFGIQQEGTKYEEHMSDGIPVETRIRASSLQKLYEGGLEGLGGEIFLRYLRGSQTLRRGLINMVNEGLIQEGSQQAAELLVDKIIAGKNVTPQQFAYEVGMAALVGMIVSGPYTFAASYAESRSPYRQIQEKYNMTDAETDKVFHLVSEKVNTYAGQTIAKALNSEAADLEIKIAEFDKSGEKLAGAKASPEMAATEITMEALTDQKIAKLHEMRAEVENSIGQFTEEEKRQHIADIDTMLQDLTGETGAETPFSRKPGKVDITNASQEIKDGRAMIERLVPGVGHVVLDNIKTYDGQQALGEFVRNSQNLKHGVIVTMPRANMSEYAKRVSESAFELFLTRDEQNRLLAEAQLALGANTIAESKKVIGERFAEYWQKRQLAEKVDKSAPEKIQVFFDKVSDILTRFAGIGEQNIERIRQFHDYLYTGKIAQMGMTGEGPGEADVLSFSRKGPQTNLNVKEGDTVVFHGDNFTVKTVMFFQGENKYELTRGGKTALWTNAAGLAKENPQTVLAQGEAIPEKTVEHQIVLDSTGHPVILGNPPINAEEMFGLKPGDLVSRIGAPAKSGKSTSANRFEDFTPPVQYVGTYDDAGTKNMLFKMTTGGQEVFMMYAVGDGEIYLRNEKTNSILIHKAKFTKAEPVAAVETAKAKPTQKEQVKAVLLETPKTIQEIAQETRILEPNVRRILGVGTKEGTFIRVDEGVYVLNTGGKSIAYVVAGDAVNVLERLAKKGFKVDMFFLDIPYDTAAVKGGNRGVKFPLISTTQFMRAMKSIAELAGQNTPVYYMWSTAPTGLKDMLAYNKVLTGAGFKLVAEGEFKKVTKTGKADQMFGRELSAEKIWLLTKSGEFQEKEWQRNLNFTMRKVTGGYQTEKPLAMMDSLVRQGTEAGQLALDAYAGSGALSDAAIRAGRKTLAIEIQQAQVEKIKARLEKAAAETKPAEPTLEQQIAAELQTLLPGGQEPPVPPTPKKVAAGAPEPGGMKAQDVTKIVDVMGQKFKNLPNILVLQTVEQARAAYPETVNDAEGFFDRKSGNVVLIADNIVNTQRAAFVVLHETIGHYGFAGIFDKETRTKLMGDIYDSHPEIKRQADEMMKNEGLTKELATEEVIADMAPGAATITLLQKTIALVKQALRDVGIKIDFSDVDILHILNNARLYVEEAVPLEKQPQRTAQQKQADFYERQARADIARDQLKELRAMKKSLRGSIRLYPDGFMAEELSRIPKYFISKDVNKNLPDEAIDEINSQFGTQLKEVDDLINFLESIPEQEQRHLQTIEDAVPERITKTETAIYKERARVQEAKRAAVAGVKEAAAKRIDALRERIAKFKVMSAEQRDALRNQLREKLAEQKTILVGKMVRGDIKRRDLELYVRENLPMELRGKYLRMIARTTHLTDMAKAFSRITEGIDKYRQDTVIQKIERIFDVAKGSKSIAIEYQKMIGDVKAMFSSTTPRAQTIRTLQETKKYIDSEIAAGRDPQVPQYVYDSLGRLKAVPLTSLDVAELENIHDKLTALITAGATKLNLRKAAYDRLQQMRLQQLAAGTKGMFSYEKTPVGTGLAIKPREYQGRTKIKNAFIDAINAARIAHFRLMPMDVIWDMMDGLQDFQGPNYRIFKREFDTKYAAYLTDRSIAEKTIHDMAEKAKLTDHNFRRIGVYAASVQESGIEKLLASGISEKEIAALHPGGTQALTKDEMALYQEMRRQLDALQPKLADVMRLVYNQDLKSVKDYFPFMRDFDAMGGEELRKYFLPDAPSYGDKPKKEVEKSFTLDRVGGKLWIRLNAMDIFMRHMDNALYLIHAAEHIRQITELATSEQYATVAGDMGQRLAMEWVDILARKGIPKGAKSTPFLRFLDGLRKNTALVSLGFRISSTLIQETALFDGAAIIGPGYTASGLRNFAFSQEWRAFLKKHSQEFAQRVGDDPNYLDFGGHQLLDKVGSAGFWALKEIDYGTAGAILAGAYQKVVESKGEEVNLDKVDKEAMREAERMMRRSQASAFFKDTPLALSQGVLGTPNLGKLTWQFQSFILNRWSMIEHEGLRYGLSKGQLMQAMNIFVFLSMATAVETGIRHGLRDLIDYLIELSTGDAPDRYEKSYWTELAENAYGNVPMLAPILYELGIMDAMTGSETPREPGNKIPIPALTVLVNIIKEGSAALNVKSSDKRMKHLIKFAALAAGTRFGIAGAGQASDILGDVVESVF